MDRDYTTDAEQELLDNISSLNGINSQFPFSTNYQNLGVTDPANGSPFFNNYQNNNSLLYGSLYNSSIPNAFARVRNYDATAAGVSSGNNFANAASFFGISNQMDGIGGSSAGLASFKSALENAVSAIDLSAVGSGTSDVINLLKNSNDIANGTIFGDSYEYANDVFELGFEEEAGRSYAYYEEALDRVFDVDENGVVTYDMDEVEDILSKDADEITEAEYYAVALAFTYMGEHDMETTICLLMDEGEDHDYTWIQENIGMQEDYTEWQLDDDKYESFCNGLNNVSNQNLLTINVLDYAYEDTGDTTYRDLADAEYERRLDIVQRCALVESLSNVKSFRADMGDDDPDIDIDILDDGSLRFEFHEWGIVEGTQYTDNIVTSNLHESSIVIGSCHSGVGTDITTTNAVNIANHNHFAAGFNSDGFEDSDACAMFWISHVLGFGGETAHAYVSNGIGESVKSLNNIAGEAVPYVDVLITSVVNGVVDYNTGVNNALFLENQEVLLESGNVYNVFDCNTCMVTYDMCDHHGESGLYAQAGRDTVVRVVEYNYYTGNSYTIEDIINNPSDMHDEFTDLIDNGREDVLDTVSDGGYADILD